MERTRIPTSPSLALPARARARRHLPLAPRLALRFAVPSVVAVITCGLVAYAGTRDALEVELGRRLCALAHVAAASIPADLAATLEVGDEDTRTSQNIRRRLQWALAGGSASRVILADTDRRVRVDSAGVLPIGAEATRLQFDQVEIDRALAGTPTASVLFQGPDGQLYKSCYAAVPDAAPPMIVAVDGAADLFRTLRTLAGLFALLLLVALALLVVTASATARSLARPLAELSGRARAMGEGALDQPVSVSGQADPEVVEVAQAMDEMRRHLAARDQERQMMLAGIAHEIRNPLGGMELYAGILAETVGELPDTVPEPLRDEARNAVARVRKELACLSSVVNDFLSFARDQPPQRRNVVLRDLLGEVANLCGPEARARGVTVTVGAVTPEGLSAELDEGQLRRALLNLAQNAVQASPSGTTVELAAGMDGPFLVLAVADQGPGMEATQLESALTPFFTTKEKGTGLGLPLVVKIARTHGGRLDVTTTPGQGCVARLVLPHVPPG